MNKSVLGRDPFSRPASPSPGKGTRTRPARKKRRRRPEKKARADRKAAPARVQKPLVSETPEPREPKSKKPESREPESREIDRIELLETAAAAEGSFDNILHSSTRFVRPSFYGKKLGHAYMRHHAEEVDPFGFDPVYWNRVSPFLEFLFDKYWRVKLQGIENIPAQGRVLLVANHSGTLPYDGAMLKVAIEEHHPSGRPVRFLVEDFVFHFPFLGAFMNRIGGVRACQDNARRLLENEQLVAVFPEGIKGIGKLYRNRYKLQRFGRGGFLKLALRTRSPIVPVSIVGAEEIHPMLARMGFLARPLGLPYLPVTPTFPWLGPLGAVPLPSKWLISFGKPVNFDKYSAADSDDPLIVMELAEKIRATIQRMTDKLIEERGHAFI
ncbi:MAG TPA: lysophospholipid acyltransferase family protein [Myxococcota bacterium]|nr:lysophospholipid acyltransferase family protein [Myxococcota bacterium]